MGGPRTRPSAGILAVLVAAISAACSTTASSTAPTSASPDATTTSTTTSTTPVTSTTSTPPVSSSSTTSTTPTTEPSPTTTVASTTLPPTTVALPVGVDWCPPTGQTIWEQRDRSEIPSPTIGPDWRREVIGASVQGRELVLLTRPVADPAHRVLVVGAIHGNEPASPPTVRGLLDADVPDDVELYLVPEANPDGVAAGVRCNANGVDLNRNFPWGWRADDGGPAPLSEPETAALAGLIERIVPDVVVWVHQPYGYVSSIGPTSSAYEEAWAAGSGTPVRPDVTQHGGGESWTALQAGRPSMLIEIDTWDATPAIVAAHRRGFEALVAQLG